MEVVRLACAQISDWQQKHGISKPVAVNVSPIQLAQPGFCKDVLATLADYGLTTDLLELEITETAMLEGRAVERDTLGGRRRPAAGRLADGRRRTHQLETKIAGKDALDQDVLVIAALRTFHIQDAFGCRSRGVPRGWASMNVTPPFNSRPLPPPLLLLQPPSLLSPPPTIVLGFDKGTGFDK